MEPLAKPSGIALTDHTRHVREQVAAVLRARPFLIFKYAQRTGHNLLTLADACACWHDEGKKHPRWRQACRLDYEEAQRTGVVRGRNLQQAKVRHEFDSLVRMRQNADCRWLPAAAFAQLLSRMRGPGAGGHAG